MPGVRFFLPVRKYVPDKKENKNNKKYRICFALLHCIALKHLSRTIGAMDCPAHGAGSHLQLGASMTSSEPVRRLRGLQTLGLAALILILCTGAALAAPQAGPYTISGTVYSDPNGNCNRDPAETGFSGWTVILADSSGATIATTLTDANGFYRFDTPGPGTYTVSEVPGSDCWVPTTPKSGSCTLTLSADKPDASCDFGNIDAVNPVHVITGTVFDDLNGNGIWDALEPVLSGWTIAVSSLGGAPFGLVQTLTDGSYFFVNSHAAGSIILPDGTYTLSEVILPGWVATTPADGTTTVTVSADSPAPAINFGNMQAGPVPVPEFPSAVLPAAVIAGLLAVVFFVRRTREN